jgi:hypothetical protein
MVRGVKYYNDESIDEKLLLEVINEAIVIDDYSLSHSNTSPTNAKNGAFQSAS